MSNQSELNKHVAGHHAGIDAFQICNDLMSAHDIALDFEGSLYEAAHVAAKQARETLDVSGAVETFAEVLKQFRALYA